LARSPAAGADRGDHDLNPNMRAPEDMRDAAVLVPLVDRPEGLTILLTKRTPHLSKHAGQIAFPGGRAEEHDADMVATALRETEEEIGLTRDRIEPVGRLDRYATRTGYIVTPIVAIVHPPFTLALDRHEVADAFEAPLSFFLDAANRVREEGVYKGESRAFYVFPYRDRRIWGATAGMLVNLADLLAG
jgi:8-oxo-dGTP pyrophosphatase MutT (NUDIX family)